jgi:hypothetical protein
MKVWVTRGHVTLIALQVNLWQTRIDMFMGCDKGCRGPGPHLQSAWADIVPSELALDALEDYDAGNMD